VVAFLIQNVSIAHLKEAEGTGRWLRSVEIGMVVAAVSILIRCHKPNRSCAARFEPPYGASDYLLRMLLLTKVGADPDLKPLNKTMIPDHKKIYPQAALVFVCIKYKYLR
jgi:hypothetical protein